MSGKKILIVEDEKQLQNLLAIFLQPQGYTLKAASDGMEALEMVEKEIPDLILLDLKLPVMNGFEFYRHFKEKTADREVPVVIVSALKNEEARINAAELGAVDYITKPFKAQEILTAVRRYLGD